MVSTRLLGGAGVEYRGLAAVATLLPTLVWTRETLATMPLLNCKLCGHHFICFAWCFFGICFLYENYPSLLIRVATNYWQGQEATIYAAESPVRAIVTSRGEVSHNTSAHSRFQARTLDPPRLLSSCLFHSQHLCQVVTSSCRHLPSFKFLGLISCYLY